MDRSAIFVDAGYVFAQGSCLLTGKKQPRGEVNMDLDKLLAALENLAQNITGVPLLRIYWYDGTSMGPTPQHVALAFKPRVKVRLGFVNTAGQQKGVDSLIVTDMITLARNRAMSDAVLLSGDEDLRVGVQQAQEFGVRVHLLGITPCRGSQSQFLLQESDTTHEWSHADVSAFLSIRVKAAPLSAAAPVQPSGTGNAAAKPAVATLQTPVEPTSIPELAKQAADEVEEQLIDGVLAAYDSSKQVPLQLDRPLLGKAKRLFGILKPEKTWELRNAFVAALRSRASATK